MQTLFPAQIVQEEKESFTEFKRSGESIILNWANFTSVWSEWYYLATTIVKK